MAEHSSALIYTIGIFDPDDEDKNPDVLRRLAGATGGEAFFPGQLERCSGDLRTHRARHPPPIHARICFHQRGETGRIPIDSRSRSSAGNGKLAVRTRAGYIASKAEQVRLIVAKGR